MSNGEGGIWVRSDVLPDGRYAVTINVGDDVAYTLDRSAAVAYAVAAVKRATEAEHDTAVFTLLTQTLGMEKPDAVGFISAFLRPDRPDKDAETGRVQFVPAVGRKGPWLKLLVDGEHAGDLTPADLRDHALAVLSCLAAADLDAAPVRSLVGGEVTEDQARGLVADLARVWPESGPPRAMQEAP